MKAVRSSCCCPYLPEVEIKEATIKDAGIIAAIVSSAISNGDFFRKPNTPISEDTISRKTVQGDIASKERTWYVCKAKKEDKILAVMLYNRGHLESSIGWLAADPSVKGAGFGSILLAQAEKVAREEQQKTLTLKLASVNARLLQYYERHGYTLTGKEEEYYQPVIRPEWQGKDNAGKWKVTVIEMSKPLKSTFKAHDFGMGLLIVYGLASLFLKK